MDDNELGAILDRSVPGAPPDAAALARIRRRAGQRRRRAFATTAAATIVVAGAATLGASALIGNGPGPKVVGPAQTTQLTRPTTTLPFRTSTSWLPVTTTTTVATTTTTMPISTPPCAAADVTLTVDANFQGTAGTFHWPVMAENTSATPCAPQGTLVASVVDANGSVVSAIPGNPATQPLPASGFTAVLAPGVPTNIAYLGWSNPCSPGPVRLVASGIGQSVPLNLPKQACGAGPIATSHVQIEQPQ